MTHLVVAAKVHAMVLVYELEDVIHSGVEEHMGSRIEMREIVNRRMVFIIVAKYEHTVKH